MREAERDPREQSSTWALFLTAKSLRAYFEDRLASAGSSLATYRTLDEIARWSGMTDAERQTIMEELRSRRKALDVPEVAVPPLS